MTGIHYHPDRSGFFIQLTPGYIWFTHVPDGGDTSVEVRQLPLDS